MSNRLLKFFTFVASLSIVVACGGGGGGTPVVNNATSTNTSTSTSSTTDTSDTSDTEDSSSSSSSSDSLPQMLSDIADNVIIPNYEDLATKTAALSAATGVNQYCDAIGTADEATELEAVKTAWRGAADAFAMTDPHAVGPIADNSGTQRDRINSYVGVFLSECSIDKSVIQRNDSDFSLSSKSSNQRGLGAIEYLLFETDQSHACAPQIDVTANWNALTEGDRRKQRCDYAERLATDISTAAAEVVASWKADDGNYRADFVAASSAGESLQDLTDVMIIHMDKEAKDRKVGIPTGVKAECSSLSCPELVENPYTETSLTSIKKNLEGFVALFNGGTGSGFDDLITAEGYESTVTDLLAKAQAAIANVDASSVSLLDQATAIVSETQETACSNAYVSPDTNVADYSGCALTGLMKRVSDILKIDFVTIVGVNLPGRVQADND